MMRRTFLMLSAVLALTASALAQEKLPPNAKLVRLEAQPQTLTLKHPFDYSQLIVTGILESGERVDVTRLAQIDKPNLIAVTPTGLVRPLADDHRVDSALCRFPQRIAVGARAGADSPLSR